MNILVCYGTRPELIKIKPLLNAFKANDIWFKTLRVEQHTTLISDSEQDDYTVSVPSGSNRLDALLGTANCISEDAFKDVTHVLVQGDTATAFVCAMAAFHRNIPVIHLEAGLRTYDTQNPYPEETYRQLISKIADIHLCPTEQNRLNIIKESSTAKTYVVGNTVLDNLVDLRASAMQGNQVIVTLHRRENHPIMDKWFTAVNQLATKYPEYHFVIPLHPNPNVQKHKDLLTNVSIVAPIPYEYFVRIISGCAFAISDSGGIQEEVSFLGKAVVVCRKVTERPESLGSNSFLCESPNRLIDIVETIVLPKLKQNAFSQSNVYGDGNASSKIVKVLKEVTC
jgi:UDP-N-acetylglucosamine 2-epimerase (non-hydrolysing)